MKKKLVCSMLVVAMCASSLVSASATTVSDNDVEVSANEVETVDEVKEADDASMIQESQEVAAETAVPMIQGVAESVRTHEVDSYTLNFLGTKGSVMKAAIYKKGESKTKPLGFISAQTAEFDSNGKATIVLDTKQCKAGDYEILYYYGDDTESAITLPFEVRKSLDAKLNTKITKTEAAKVVYTGSDVEPVVTIVDKSSGSEYTLVKDKDYTVKVTSENKKNYGVGEVEITGIGDYTGTITQKFNIVPTAPSVSAVECTGYKSAKITWNKVAGVDGYDIERKTGDEEFKSVGTVSGEGTVSFIDKDENLVTGKTYVYRVKAVKYYDSAKEHWVESEAGTSGISVKLLPSAPKNIKIVSTSSNQFKLTWDKVDGAMGYIIYQVLADGTQKQVKAVTGTTHTVKKDITTKKALVCGKNYTYIVKAYINDPEKNEKIFSNNTQTITVKAKPITPKLVSAKTDGYNNVTVKWKKVKGSYGYAVYRKVAGDDNAKWKKIKTLRYEDTLSYVDKKATTGVTYLYSVKSYVKVNGKKVYSDLDQTGKKVTPLPAKTAFTLGYGGTNGKEIVMRIANAKGADGYYIYRKTNGGEYKNIAIIDAKSGDVTTYTDKEVAAKSTLEYYILPFVDGETKRIKGTKSDSVVIYSK